MKDKDLRAMARILFPAASAIVLTRVPYKRSASPGDLLAAAPPLSRARSSSSPTPARPSSWRCRSPGRERRAPVVIAGSLFLIGEVKRLRLFG